MTVSARPLPWSRIGLFAGLCWLYTCIHLQRQLLSVLAESVKSSLTLSDANLGALTGSAFSIVYALLGLHFGRVADSADRLRLVQMGAWVWSLASLGAAFAPGYSALIAARAAVATGEAIATAAAISLMIETAGEPYRARASSVFFAAAFLGAGLAAILGGASLHWFADGRPLPAWRTVFVMAALPGILGALYLRSHRSADRTRSRSVTRLSPVTWLLVAAAAAAVMLQMGLPPAVGVPAAVAVAAAAGWVWIRTLRIDNPPAHAATFGHRTFGWMLLTYAAILFADYAASFWLIPYSQRRFGISASMAGEQLGGMIIFAGLAGCVLGGFTADRLRRRWVSGRIGVSVICVLVEAAAVVLAVQCASYASFCYSFALFCAASGGWTGIAAAVGTDIIPPSHRSTGIAAYFLITTLLGPALGSYTAGVISDRTGSLSVGLLFCCLPLLLAALGLVRLAKLYARDDRLITLLERQA